MNFAYQKLIPKSFHYNSYPVHKPADIAYTGIAASSVMSKE